MRFVHVILLKVTHSVRGKESFTSVTTFCFAVFVTDFLHCIIYKLTFSLTRVVDRLRNKRKSLDWLAIDTRLSQVFFCWRQIILAYRYVNVKNTKFAINSVNINIQRIPGYSLLLLSYTFSVYVCIVMRFLICNTC